MNIFWLSNDPAINARYHNDKHVVKMAIEYAQLLSTAHRVLDGTKLEVEHPHTERPTTVYLLPGEMIVWDEKSYQYTGPLYKQTHMEHPCAKWARANRANYEALYDLYCHVCDEYAYRYDKDHGSNKLYLDLLPVPVALRSREPVEISARPYAMPEQYKGNDVIESYRSYYRGAKHWSTWTNRDVPEWFV